VRLGILVPVGPSAGLGEDVAADAATIEQSGLDVALLQGDPGGSSDALTAAAFLAGSTEALRLIACVPAGVHPIHIAEQAAVADNALQGRLVVALHGSVADLVAETAVALLAATGPRPFHHQGERWSIPGRVEGNISERRISVTPNPAQLELPVWVGGSRTARVAAELGLSYLSGVDGGEAGHEAADAWAAIEGSLGRAVLRMRRPAVRAISCAPNGDFDDASVTRSLAEESERWGLDLAVIRLPATLSAAGRRRAIGRVASLVRPPLQMDAIPARVQEYWDRELPARLEA
jgi:alkanesulfonate monooxygenase SsuD/methylene tetrahydromethanopterin reductase-like flavin-dependent oxidoreductase (luciferase family)